MKTINEQREEIMLAVKRAVGENSVTYEPDSDYCMFSCDDIDHIAEEVADNLIENGYREICAGACDELDTVEYGVVGTLKGMIEQLKNEIDALKDELRRVSEDSKERDNENLRMQSAIDDISEENNRLREAIEDFTVKKCGLRCEIVKTLIKEFATKLKQKCRNFYPSIDHYCCSEKAVSVKDIDELLKEYEK